MNFFPLAGLFGAHRAPAPMTDHDRIIVQEERLERRVEAWEKEARHIIDHLDTIEVRLNGGNKTFRDMELFKERVTEELADLRNSTGKAHLSADRAGRVIEELAKQLDRQARAQEQDTQKLIQEAFTSFRGLFGEELRALKADLHDHGAQLESMKDTLDRWTTQGTLLQRLFQPGITILLAILTTLVFKWLGL
jgi:chromosome segregation ATPase